MEAITKEELQSATTGSEEECKDQKLVQSSTTPHRGIIWESDKNTRKHHTQESQQDNPFAAREHKYSK